MVSGWRGNGPPRSSRNGTPSKGRPGRAIIGVAPGPGVFPTESTMPISGLVIEVKPGSEAAIAAEVNALPGLEVTETGQGVLIATLDTLSVKEDKAANQRLGEVAGVLAVNVAFTSVEDCAGNGRS